jgi:hypothetical protein
MVALAIVVLALVPRLMNLDLFVTPDEDNWMRRGGNFARAVEQGELQRTYQSGHPGVTTMWLMWVGAGREASSVSGITTQDNYVTHHPRFIPLLTSARVVVAVVNAALIGIATLLAWRLGGPLVALIAGGLIALEPFLVAHGQVLHLDALSTAFICVALLACAAYWTGGSRWYLVLCSAASGLAILTKAPSAFLGIAIPIAAAGAAASRGRVRWRRWFAELVICGLGAVLVVVALWPALWVAPIDTVRRWIEFTIETGGSPHLPGNYFLGRPVADPGNWFYPVAIAYRLTPTVVLGCVLAAVFWAPAERRWLIWLCFDFLIGFVLFLSVAGKKLDRYALPLFPFFALMAAIGYAELVHRVPEGRRRMFATVAFAAVVGSQAMWTIASLPYPLAYYNPLLGGVRGASEAILVGWGEGLDQVAGYLNSQPDAENSRIGVYFPLTVNFQAMVRGSVVSYGDKRPVDYVVDYISAAQRRQTPRIVRDREPDFVATIGGVEYARVYRLDPPQFIPDR